MEGYVTIDRITTEEAQARKSGKNNELTFIDSVDQKVKVIISTGTEKKIQCTIGGLTGDVTVEA